MSKKTVIIYASTHHKNTYKLVKAISDKHNVDIIDATRRIISVSKLFCLENIIRGGFI